MLQGKDNLFCLGIECPIRSTCLRYSHGLVVMENDGTTDRFIRKCTNQKKFVQDSQNVNQDVNRI